MTALEQYTRLETLGQWRESPEAEPKEVIVSFGNATLLLSDVNENPLGHWAMAATLRISLDGSRAVYTPDTEGYETLEIDDAQMVEAIAQVSQVANESTRKTPWFRWFFVAFILSAGVVLAKATPDLLRDQAVRMTSPESARKLGSDMVAALELPICREPRADAAKTQLQLRAFPNDDVLLLVTTDITQINILPGNIILIGDALLRSLQSADDLAAVMHALIDQNTDNAAVFALFHDSSLRELLDYITSGTLPEARIDQAAQRAIITPIGPLAATERPVQMLRDQDWVALQGICLK